MSALKIKKYSSLSNLRLKMSLKYCSRCYWEDCYLKGLWDFKCQINSVCASDTVEISNFRQVDRTKKN